MDYHALEQMLHATGTHASPGMNMGQGLDLQGSPLGDAHEGLQVRAHAYHVCPA